MNFIKACSAFFLISFLFASCMDGSTGGSAENGSDGGIYGQDTRTLLYSEIADTVWFASNEYRFDFPEDQDKKIVYLNYMPDGLNTEKWIQLTADENGITKANIIYSTNIREIGKISDASFYRTGDGNVCFKCDFLSASGMQLASENSASTFDYEKVPALKADYLSNFDGKYKLKNSDWELQIGAKLSIQADTSRYWVANVLATEYDKETETYDLLLAHSSARDASGSTSPGITGNEPFKTRQGLFWTHCTLKSAGGGEWRIQWSSEWKESPAEAMESELDMDDTFNGPTETKMHYVFNFYFGNPVKDSDGWWTVENGNWIGAYKEDSYTEKKWTWNELKDKIPSYSIPEDKLEDYWWYSTNSITPIETSYVYRLSDSTELSLENYDIYLALKDKPKPVELPCDGIFVTKAGGGHTLKLNGSGYNYDGTDYTCIQVKKWLEGSANNGYAVLLTDGTSIYASYLQHYFEKDYFHVRPPKLYKESSLPDKSDFSIMNSLIKNFAKQ